MLPFMLSKNQAAWNLSEGSTRSNATRTGLSNVTTSTCVDFRACRVPGPRTKSSAATTLPIHTENTIGPRLGSEKTYANLEGTTLASSLRPSALAGSTTSRRWNCSSTAAHSMIGAQQTYGSYSPVATVASKCLLVPL